jgi:hypothetical protein
MCLPWLLSANSSSDIAKRRLRANSSKLRYTNPNQSKEALAKVQGGRQGFSEPLRSKLVSLPSPECSEARAILPAAYSLESCAPKRLSQLAGVRMPAPAPPKHDLDARQRNPLAQHFVRVFKTRFNRSSSGVIRSFATSSAACLACFAATAHPPTRVHALEQPFQFQPTE